MVVVAVVVGRGAVPVGALVAKMEGVSTEVVARVVAVMVEG
jgi:hypothetical protein